MSAYLLGVGFRADMGTCARKLILLKLIDACEDDGSRIFPAVATVARAAQCSARQVQRELRVFVDVGLLRVVREGGKGPGSTREYAMDLDVLGRIASGGWDAFVEAAPAGDEAAPDAPESEVPEADPSPDKGDTVSPFSPGLKGDKSGLRVTPVTVKGDNACHPTPYYPSIDPEREARARDLSVLAELWPRKTDPLGPVEAELAAMNEADRKAAVDGAPGYLHRRRAEKCKHFPMLVNYLRQRLWEQVPEESHRAAAGEAAKPEVRLLAAFSPEWWLFVWWLAVTDPRKAALWVSMGVQRKSPLTVNVGSDEERRLAAIKPAFRLIEPPFDDAAVAWLREFGRTGADLGERDRKFVVVPTGAPGTLGELRSRLAAMGGGNGRSPDRPAPTSPTGRAAGARDGEAGEEPHRRNDGKPREP